jgi:hypothetical protein
VRLNEAIDRRGANNIAAACELARAAAGCDGHSVEAERDNGAARRRARATFARVNARRKAERACIETTKSVANARFYSQGQLDAGRCRRGSSLQQSVVGRRESSVMRRGKPWGVGIPR